MAKKIEREVAVIDFETDPFVFERIPKPFACGILWRNIYLDFWGNTPEECWRCAVDYLLSIKTPLLIYAHNGGKFDFFFLWPVLENPIKIINARIVAAKLGIHELRDSWAIMPFALAKYQKTQIDYALFEADHREANKALILDYLHDDCIALKALCDAFVARFGPMLTVAGTAMKELVKLHPQEPLSESHDKKFRDYYFGGRVECFDSGIHSGHWKVYDVNSMYPSVMKNFDHPLGAKYMVLENVKLDRDGWIKGFKDAFYFCEVTGYSKGALPYRSDSALVGLQFPTGMGTYKTTSHELRAAVLLGLFRVETIHRVYIPRTVQRFELFVDTFTREKAEAKHRGDKINELFAKYIVNSAYGKFGTNPENFKDWFIRIHGLGAEYPTCKTCANCKAGLYPCETWKLENAAPNQWSIYAKPTEAKRFYDVAIAASVTSAARAVLMKGLAGAKSPIYCDTDSIICKGLQGVELDEYELGAWKLEAEGSRIAIAGKKLYALFDRKGKAVKWASKGTKIAPESIERIAQGEVILWQSDAPTFSLTGKTKFISRKARKTA